MNDDFLDIIDKELDNIDVSLDNVDDSKLSNDISKLVHEQNEKVMKEKMKKEIIRELVETGADFAYSEDMNYDTLENMLNENK